MISHTGRDMPFGMAEKPHYAIAPIASIAATTLAVGDGDLARFGYLPKN